MKTTRKKMKLWDDVLTPIMAFVYDAWPILLLFAVIGFYGFLIIAYVRA